MGTNDTAQMPGAERDDETGKYREKYPEEDFLEAVTEPSGTQNVADAVGCSYDHAYKTLRRLEEEGRVSSERVGNARLWRLDEEDTGT